MLLESKTIPCGSRNSPSAEPLEPYDSRNLPFSSNFKI
jgi:hypothetical protein